MTTLDTIQSLWIGGRLSVMEQLCIRSFLDCGHPFHLYAYEDIEGVPQGTVVIPGDKILPAREIFVYRRGAGKGSPSAFSNYFRYKLLLERGGWWADLDAACVRSLEFADEHVYAHERQEDGNRQLGSGLMKMPVGSPVAEYCWRECQQVDRRNLRWGQIGPRLTSRAVAEVAVEALLLPPEAFYPIDYFQVQQFLGQPAIPDDCYSIHLWHSRWQREGLDPDARYDPQCLYEQLKAKHGIQSPPTAIRWDEATMPPKTPWMRLLSRLRKKTSALVGRHAGHPGLAKP